MARPPSARCSRATDARTRSWTRASFRASDATSARSPARTWSPPCASESAMTSPTPTPQLPWRAAPRASSRTRHAAWWNGVTTGASPLTVTRASASRTPAAASRSASTSSAVGWTTTRDARCVRTPSTNVPAPICENVWCCPSAVTTLCPACAPPLNRTTRPARPERARKSTTSPFPASPKPRSTTATARAVIGPRRGSPHRGRAPARRPGRARVRRPPSRGGGRARRRPG